MVRVWSWNGAGVGGDAVVVSVVVVVGGVGELPEGMVVVVVGEK